MLRLSAPLLRTCLVTLTSPSPPHLMQKQSNHSFNQRSKRESPSPFVNQTKKEINEIKSSNSL